MNSLVDDTFHKALLLESRLSGVFEAREVETLLMLLFWAVNLWEVFDLFLSWKRTNRVKCLTTCIFCIIHDIGKVDYLQCKLTGEQDLG